jgi:phage terminase large subunit-like protein
MSACIACHNVIEAQTPEPIREVIRGMPTVQEDAEFYYDELAATAPIRFAAKYCSHWQGELRGQPFILHPTQQEIIKPVFGYLSRETKARKYTQMWFEGAVGCGKTPVLSILGLFGLLGDNEAGAQLYCVAADHAQANYAYQCAKNFIKNGPLQKLVDKGSLIVKQYEIKYLPTDSVWMITSGKGPKAGGAPSMVLFDEIHQVKDREVYDDLQGRMSKRRQPLMVCATNTAKKPNSLYADLHEEAEQTLTGGPRANRRLFPVIWAAPRDADPASPESWAMANPLLGVTIQPEKIKDEWERAKGSPALENRFRLQYLGQQVSDTARWLDVEGKWIPCEKPIDLEAVKDSPRFVGFDGSNGDDLVAWIDCYATPDAYHIASRFYMPKATADRYHALDLVDYPEWGAQGAIELLQHATISIIAQQHIAKAIIDSHAIHPITCLAYDRAYAGGIVTLVQAAGIKCEPIAQGWTLWGACQELERRLTERSIHIDPNPVLRFCASNVTLTYNKGSYWPKKPDAKGRGGKCHKIDGISALVTALTEARKTSFSAPAPHVGALMLSI